LVIAAAHRNGGNLAKILSANHNGRLQKKYYEPASLANVSKSFKWEGKRS